MRSFVPIVFLLVQSMLYMSCSNKEPEADVTPTGRFPSVKPEDLDQNSLQARIQVGRVLFYDDMLSFNNSMSCGTCHKQEESFSNQLQFDKGAKGNILTRNTPPIFGNSEMLFWDGRASTMNDLVLGPLASHAEMMQDLNILPGKLAAIAYYPPLFQKAYGSPEITIEKIRDLLSTFCRNIQPGPSTFNQALAGSPGSDLQTRIRNMSGISEEAKEGALLFFGKAKCEKCHDSFVPSIGYTNGNTTTATNTRVFKDIGLDVTYKDKGLGALTLKKSDEGLFRLPQLFNLQYTGPYMHDGRYKTLEEVVEHYNSGVKQTSNLSEELCDSTELSMGRKVPAKLNLSASEKKALVEFLKIQDNTVAMKSTSFSNPFK